MIAGGACVLLHGAVENNGHLPFSSISHLIAPGIFRFGNWPLVPYVSVRSSPYEAHVIIRVLALHPLEACR